MAEKRAGKFGAGKLGKIAGLAHDIGKYSREFQARLTGSSERVDHATAGAQEMCRRFGPVVGQALAYIIAGHHSGLPDGNGGDAKNLPARLKKELPPYYAFEQEVTIPELSNQDLAAMPRARDKDMAAFSFAFCIRMLYSCLVDADYLDTERFMQPEKFQSRPSQIPLTILLSRFEKMAAALAARNRQNPRPINVTRQEILERCLDMSESEPGLFTLTVPTGGGKTYSSLAFGLKHAVKYNMDRIIYVVPYTSIIEQNAQVFRDVLEDKSRQENVVLEHHSNFEYPPGPLDGWDRYEKAHRLAADNWDMPVVVTTAVQFFESLYANRGSRCRKLHNLVNSVIILDEAQMIPIEYIKPCLWALAELVFNYHTTVVLCTATQPAINELLPGGLRPREIMRDPQRLQKLFKRVTVNYCGNMSDDELAAAMAEREQVLTIVNTRRHARLLFERLRHLTAEGIYHLSARMCPAHRKKLLTEIRQALQAGRPCRVVSTQLIEAGVDVDFPVVYRAAAGIDSIAQAAGRCNRENRQKEGHVYVFDPEAHGMPQRGRFAEVAGLTRSTMRRLQRFDGDLLSLAAIEDYFKQLLATERDNLDAEGIIQAINGGREEKAFPFATIAAKFQFIDSPTVAVVVPYNDNDDAKDHDKVWRLMEKAEHHPYPASMARSLQPYVVQIYQHELAALEKAGAIRTVGDFMKFLTDRSFYDAEFGLRDAEEVKAPTEVLMF